MIVTPISIAFLVYSLIYLGNNSILSYISYILSFYCLLVICLKTPTGHWGDYSFQFWMTPEGDGYRADGAFGQYTFIWPKYDLALSIQRPEDDKNGVMLEILKEEVLSKLK